MHVQQVENKLSHRFLGHKHELCEQLYVIIPKLESI